ncbi:MAG: CxxC-x17-CxxC domain-containing protein [Dehalococcoides mccartyi]|uniref:CxxC-x17-CxxC domain-containing protein n=1 Tax=Dehalococcoides mccartyi TaxID=61435 RepID=UPI0030FB6C17
MVLQEKTLTCLDCGKNFVFTVEEQEFFASKGYTNEPKRCPDCCRKKRAAKRDNGYDDNPKEPRQMFPAICARCGKETTVPFQPRGNKPVYCRECYELMKTRQPA